MLRHAQFVTVFKWQMVTHSARGAVSRHGDLDKATASTASLPGREGLAGLPGCTRPRSHTVTERPPMPPQTHTHDPHDSPAGNYRSSRTASLAPTPALGSPSAPHWDEKVLESRALSRGTHRLPLPAPSPGRHEWSHPKAAVTLWSESTTAATLAAGTNCGLLPAIPASGMAARGCRVPESYGRIQTEEKAGSKIQCHPTETCSGGQPPCSQ